MKKRKLNVAVAGVTGAVGQEMLRVLEARRFPVDQLIPLASKRSAGKRIGFKGNRYTVRELTKDSFAEVDIASLQCRRRHQQGIRPGRSSRRRGGGG